MPALIAPLSARPLGAAPPLPNALQAALEVRDRALHVRLTAGRTSPRSNAPQAWPRLELDREAVLESIAGGREATSMAYVRQRLLHAGVLDEAVRVERTQRHLELDGAAEQRITTRARSPGARHRDPGCTRIRPGQYSGQLRGSTM
jgi:hypothetical protein